MRLLLLAAAFVAFAAPAHAQLGFVPMAGYDIDYEAPMIGVGFEVGLTPGILPFAAALRPSVEYVFLDAEGTDLFRVNGDVIGRFAAPGVPFAPYGKAGVALEVATFDLGNDSETETEIGANVGLGAEFNRFLVEGTLGIGSISSSRIAVGYRF